MTSIETIMSHLRFALESNKKGYDVKYLTPIYASAGKQVQLL